MSKVNFKALVQETTFTSGGLLNPKQANKFVDLMVDEQVILKECDIRRMTTNEEDIDRLGLGARQMRAHSAGVRGTSSDITSSKRTLKLTEGKIFFELDIRTLRRLTIESDGKDLQGSLLRHIMEMGATQFGNDIEDLGVNGDTDNASGGATQAFLEITDGWLKLIKADGIVYDVNLVTDETANFGGMLALMPEKYKKDPKALRIYTTTAIRDAYIDEIVGLNTSASLPYLTGQVAPTFKGIPVIGVPSFPAGHRVLTMPKNLTFGIDINGIERDFGKQVVERVIEAVIIAPIGYQIANEEAVVVGYDAV